MSKYLVLIYENESSYADATPEVWGDVMKDHEKLHADVGSALVGGDALEPTSTATSIRRQSDGSFTVSDGPFAETKEALGGYYLIEAADLDAAIEIAKQVPARFGGVELRPIMVFN